MRLNKKLMYQILVDINNNWSVKNIEGTGFTMYDPRNEEEKISYHHLVELGYISLHDPRLMITNRNKGTIRKFPTTPIREITQKGRDFLDDYPMRHWKKLFHLIIFLAAVLTVIASLITIHGQLFPRPPIQQQEAHPQGLHLPQ